MLFKAAFEVLIIHPCKAATSRLARPLPDRSHHRYPGPGVTFVMQPISGPISAGDYIADY